MAKDLEDGYTRIANEVLEDLAQCKNFCVKSRVVLAIIRNTWGWKGHPKQRLLSQTYLAEATGAGLTQVKAALHELAEMGLIKRDGSMTGYNKYWEEGGRESDHGRESDLVGPPTTTWSVLDKNLVGPPTTKKENKERNRKKVTKKIAAEEIFLSEGMKKEAAKNGIPEKDVEKLFEDFRGYNGDDSHTPYKWAFIWRRWCENQKNKKGGSDHGNKGISAELAKRFLSSVE